MINRFLLSHTQQFLNIERTIFWKQNDKSKLNKISLMIEESCFRANKSNHNASANNQNNNPNNGNQINTTKNQNSQNNQNKTINQKATGNQKTTKTNKTTDKKTNSTTAAANKKVESRD